MEDRMQEIPIVREWLMSGSEKYEYRFAFVSFIDILGWRDIIEQSENDPTILKHIGAIMARIRSDVLAAEMVRQVPELFEPPKAFKRYSEPGTELETSVHYGQFSDSIVLSVFPAIDMKDPESIMRTRFRRRLAIAKITHNAQLIWENCLQHGFWARGGIAPGKMYHKENIAFGPALTQAYLVEQAAVYPRIVLHDSIEEEFIAAHVMDLHHDNGAIYLDSLKIVHDSDMELFRTIGRLIKKNLTRFRDIAQIAKKYQWLAVYYNDTLKETSCAEIEPIEIS
jgi:hypothetical protein